MAKIEIRVRFDPGHPWPHVYEATVDESKAKQFIDSVWANFVSNWDERPRGTVKGQLQTIKHDPTCDTKCEDTVPVWYGLFREGAREAFEKVWDAWTGKPIVQPAAPNKTPKKQKKKSVAQPDEPFKGPGLAAGSRPSTK